VSTRKMEKMFNQKSFKYFVWAPLGSRENINVFLQVSSLFPLFATAGAVDTGGKITHGGVVDTCSNLQPVSLTPAALVTNLPLVSLITVVHLDLLISPRIFDTIWNDSNFIFRPI
jgi:hypothetical protein